MGRLIDADEYEKRIKPYDTEDPIDKALYNFAHRKLIGTPSVEKIGKWIYDDEAYPYGNPNGHYDCDQCGESVPHKTNYCPNCGARMENE